MQSIKCLSRSLVNGFNDNLFNISLKSTAINSNKLNAKRNCKSPMDLLILILTFLFSSQLYRIIKLYFVN